jgi:hypothetical protein
VARHDSLCLHGHVLGAGRFHLYAAFRASGSSLFTLGFAVLDGLPQTLLVYSEAAMGLILVALRIAYLPTIYAACDHLARLGVPLLPDREQAWRDFAGWRVNYDTVLIRLARLTRALPAPWSSDRSGAI